MPLTSLLNLLASVTPSRTIINNCLSLIQREQVGLKKYGQALPDAGLTHEELLQHFREEMLDGANYAEAALHTARETNFAYADLRGRLEKVINDSYRPNRDSGLGAVFKRILLDHDTQRIIRGAKR